jgi:hypothetical protein
VHTTVAFLNDLHVGHPFAVCPATWTLHDGNPFTPNPLQHIIRSHWLNCWDWIADLRQGGRLVVVTVGDLIEGLHHDTTQVITSRIDTQEDMAVGLLEEGLARVKFTRGDKIRWITGSPAHDGPGAASVERIARRVMDNTEDGRLSQERWRGRVDDILFDVAHHPGAGPGSRAWLYGNAFQGWLRSLYFTALESGAPVARYVMRAHRHTFMRRTVESYTGDTVMTGFLLPGFKLKDEHVYLRAADALSSIGMVAVVIRDGCAVDMWKTIPVEQDPVEEL